MIRRARANHTTNPVVLFPENSRGARNRCWDGCVAAGDVVLHDMCGELECRRERQDPRVRLIREDDYKATYGPLISLVSEKCNNDNAIDLALGRPMDEHRFVIALTFEKLHNRRARHLRAMVIWEEALRSLPPECPRSISRSTRRAIARCRRSRANMARTRNVSASSKSGGPKMPDVDRSVYRQQRCGSNRTVRPSRLHRKASSIQTKGWLGWTPANWAA